MSAMFLLLLPLGLIASMFMDIAGSEDGPDDEAGAADPAAAAASAGDDDPSGAEAAIEAMSDDELDAFIFDKGWRDAALGADAGAEAGSGAASAMAQTDSAAPDTITGFVPEDDALEVTLFTPALAAAPDITLLPQGTGDTAVLVQGAVRAILAGVTPDQIEPGAIRVRYAA